MNPDERFEQLWTDFLEGDLSADGMAELQTLLADHPRLQSQAADLLQTHRLLGFTLQDGAAARESFAGETMRRMPQTDTAFTDTVMRNVKMTAQPQGGFRWIQWRPLWAAAAGIVFGMLCTSAVFGYVMPRAVATASRLFALVDGSFEKQSGRLASGFPVEFGAWSGDESEVVNADAVKAKDGKRMLRFVRAEGDAAVPQSPANSCDLYQLVDLRSLKTDAAIGEATLELSAQFRDARDAAGAPVQFSCRLYVFSGTPESLRAEWPLTRKEALALGSNEWRSEGGSPSTWHEMTAKVLLPAQADFAVVQLVAGKAPTSRNTPAVFVAQFADDVRLTLKTQATLPVRLAQR